MATLDILVEDIDNVWIVVRAEELGVTSYSEKTPEENPATSKEVEQ